MSGKLIYSQTISSDQMKLRLNFGGKNFSSGTYILQVTDGPKQYTMKVVRQ
jgi:hypothetical protein